MSNRHLSKKFLAALGFALILGVPVITTPASAQSSPAAEPADPNLWLEDIDGPRAMEWVRRENERSLPVLENDRRYPALLQSALQVAQNRDRLPLGGIRHGYLYNFWQDEDHVRGIWRRATIASYATGNPEWQTLLDVDALATTEHANWVWEGADCDPSGARCMISLSNGGLDAATRREFDVASRSFVADGFVIPEAKSRMAWLDRDTLLVATNWGEGSLTPSGYPFIVKRWRRGTPLSSAQELVRGNQTDVATTPFTIDDTDGAHHSFVVHGVTFFENTYQVLTPSGLRELTLPRKSTIHGLYRGRLIVTLKQEWRIGGKTYQNGELIAIPLAAATSATPAIEEIFTPNARQSIEAVGITRDAVLVGGFDNVRGRLQRFALSGNRWSGTQIALPQTGVINVVSADAGDSHAFVTYEDFLTPQTLYSLDNEAAAPRSIRALTAQFNASPYVVEQFETASRDGTRVPYFVVHRRDMQLNGQNPTLLYAYGGFQLSQTPSYSGYIGRLWLDQGGVYVLANIRGGGEFGPAWHDAGLKTHRQVIYDDFYAVEQDLVNRRITSPRRLGISGRSNGGLLMGVMLNQHPEMVHAAVVGSPLIDMLRYDQLLAGASWVGEYGSPSVPAERAFLEQISPYQNLRRRDDFPLVFIYTSTKDDRVHPGHARKYAARLEELGMPFLYYENTEGGHQATANLREAGRRRALEYMYLVQRLMD
ncbi:MAG: S9 family peptidase [Proteobacteria bacterium]|nr:S9 family peptidase [Pseudomonadota bacterium]